MYIYIYMYTHSVVHNSIWLARISALFKIFLGPHIGIGQNILKGKDHLIQKIELPKYTIYQLALLPPAEFFAASEVSTNLP